MITPFNFFFKFPNNVRRIDYIIAWIDKVNTWKASITTTVETLQYNLESTITSIVESLVEEASEGDIEDMIDEVFGTGS